jgi:periplasmic mercuric ion binding protein
MKSYVIALTLLLMGTLARADTIEMKVFGMVCGFCAQGIEANLRKNPATEEVVVSLEDKLVAVRTRAGTSIADEDLRKAIADAGYDLKEISRTSRSMAEVRQSIAAPPKS